MFSRSNEPIEYYECPYCRAYHGANELCDPKVAEYEREFRAAFERHLERRMLGVAYGDHGIAGGQLPRSEQWYTPVEEAGNRTRERLAALDRWQSSQVERTRPRVWDSGEINRYHAGSVGAVPIGRWEERREPARPASFTADVAVPAVQAGFTGLLVALAAGGVYATIWKYLLTGSWPRFGDTLAVGGALGLLAVLLLWLSLLTEHRRSLWSVVTSEFPFPTNEEPRREEPEPRSEPVSVRLEVNEGRTMRFAHFPITEDKLLAVGRLLNGGSSFSMSALSGSDKPLSRSEFVTLRDWLEANDYLEWINPDTRAQGIRLTARGKALVRALAEE